MKMKFVAVVLCALVLVQQGLADQCFACDSRKNEHCIDTDKDTPKVSGDKGCWTLTGTLKVPPTTVTTTTVAPTTVTTTTVAPTTVTTTTVAPTTVTTTTVDTTTVDTTTVTPTTGVTIPEPTDLEKPNEKSDEHFIRHRRALVGGRNQEARDAASTSGVTIRGMFDKELQGCPEVKKKYEADLTDMKCSSASSLQFSLLALIATSLIYAFK